MGRKTESAAIKVFARIKPDKGRQSHINVDLTDRKVEYFIPRDVAQGYINNTKEQYEFKFDDILGTHVEQDEVFEKIAQPIADATLSGYNGCVFAYGQTGSGKTFTITGGIDRYADRGLIPRTLEYIFQQFQKRDDYKYTLSVSYLEIYNNTGYDLLSPEHEISKLEDLPKVNIREDAEGKIHLQNLEKHTVSSEEDALNLLFLGDTNRAIGVTPMNMHSSRSHCIFTLHVEGRKRGSDLIKSSKLHLVDLAGSERVYKTQVDGKLLSEANSINLSLHYLKMCIVALQKKEEFVPYRNSMMTAVLRDSLGGNSKTVMVATLSPADRETEESISTCRFAQQVAMIENQVFVNEELDPKLLIERLKQEIKELKEELAIYKGNEASRGSLSDEELQRLRELVDSYLRSLDPAVEFRPGDMTKIRASFSIFKEKFLEVERLGGKGVEQGLEPVDSEMIKKLKLNMQQRDNEINILVAMLRQRDEQQVELQTKIQQLSGGTAAGSPMKKSGNNENNMNRANNNMLAEQGVTKSGRITPRRRDAPLQLPVSSDVNKSQDGVKLPSIRTQSRGAEVVGNGPRFGTGGAASLGPIKRPEEFDFLIDRNKAFETFRKSYRKNEVIEENKKILKEKYDAAKGYGEAVNDARKKISKLKAYVEQLRVERAMQGSNENEEDPEEEKTKKMIASEKARYKESFEALKHCKTEIEHIQKLLERSRAQLQTDFENWYSMATQQREEVLAQQGAGATVAAAPAVVAEDVSEIKGAWGGSSNGYHRPQKPSAPSPEQADGVRQLVQRPLSSGANAEPTHPPLVQRSMSGKVRFMTGNAEADQDIMAFYAAKENMLRNSSISTNS